MTTTTTIAALLLLLILAPGARAETITVPAGGNLAAAITAAKPGDVITVAAGARFVGSLTLPAKPFGPAITIRSSATLPERRIGPADLPLLPSIAASAGTAAITIDHAGNWKLDGLRLEPTTTAEILTLQNARDVTLDRLYIVAGPAGQRRGIRLNSDGAVTLRRSYIAGMWAAGVDSQAIAAWDGAGPYTITDNYLEGASENVLFGGADSSSAASMPADLVFEGNTVRKPLEWKGTGKNVKNLFELKAMRRARIRGNVFENNWVDGQAGRAIVFTPRNQNGAAPWTRVEDVVFEGNIVRNSPAIFAVLGYDDANASGQTTGIVIRNNLAIGAGAGSFALLLNEIGSITFDHNTYVQPQTGEAPAIGLYAEGKIATSTGSRAPAFAAQSLTFTNNLLQANTYGVHSSVGQGTASLAAMARAFTWRENVLGGTVAGTYPPTTYVITAAAYDSSFKPGSLYELVDGSPFRKAGTDGADLGWSGPPSTTAPPASCSVTITATPPDAAAGWTVTVTFTRGPTSATCGGGV